MGAGARPSAGPPREVYPTSPQDTPDPADYLVEIQFPIRIQS